MDVFWDSGKNWKLREPGFQKVKARKRISKKKNLKKKWVVSQTAFIDISQEKG